jgi:anti-anti-sigma factor
MRNKLARRVEMNAVIQTIGTLEEKNVAIEIRFQKIDGIQGGALFFLKGYIDSNNSAYFYQQISNFVGKGSTKLIFDCTALTYISSTGFGALFSLLKEVRRLGGDIVLFKLTPRVRELFSIIGVYSFFNVMETSDSALCFFADQDKDEKASPFPRSFNCPICSKKLRVSKMGRYRCSECKTVLRIDEAGGVLPGDTRDEDEGGLIPAKTEKAISLLTELAQLIQKASLAPMDKAAFDKMLNQIVLHIYQREVKDVWAELEELKN